MFIEDFSGFFLVRCFQMGFYALSLPDADGGAGRGDLLNVFESRREADATAATAAQSIRFL